MPLTPPTASLSAAHAVRKCTAVCALYQAGSIAVCKAGDKVALHIYTQQGEVLVHVSEREFIAGCRGPRDANGNPLRTFEQLDEEARRQANAQIDATSAEHAAQLGLSAEATAKCEAAWQLYVNDVTLSQGRAALQAGVAGPSFSVWVRHNRATEARQIKSGRWATYHKRGRTL